MRTSKSTQTRVLALQPSTRTIGFAVMEGSTEADRLGTQVHHPTRQEQAVLKAYRDFARTVPARRFGSRGLPGQGIKEASPDREFG